MEALPGEYWAERFAARGMRYRQNLSVALAAQLRADGIPAWWSIVSIMAFDRPDFTSGLTC